MTICQSVLNTLDNFISPTIGIFPLSAYTPEERQPAKQRLCYNSIRKTVTIPVWRSRDVLYIFAGSLFKTDIVQTHRKRWTGTPASRLGRHYRMRRAGQHTG